MVWAAPIHITPLQYIKFIRGTVNSREDLTDDMKLGFDTIFCHETDTLVIDGIVKRIKDRVGDNKVYISLDIDVVDPAFAPATAASPIRFLKSSSTAGDGDSSTSF